MPVETATYIHDLNAADPVHTDGLNQSDAHARLIKTVLQTTFPNLTGAVTGSPDQLNRATAGRTSVGVLEVEPNSTSAGGQVKLDPVTGSGAVLLQNSGLANQDGSLAIQVNDRTNANPTTAVTLSRVGALAAAASVNAPLILENGNRVLPPGGVIFWTGAANAIPAGWALCDGTFGTPDLRNVFIVGAGGSYVVGQTGGAASVATVTDGQGTHAHGAITAPAGPFAMSASSDVQGAHAHSGATSGVALAIGHLPPHDHGLGGQPVVVVGGGGIGTTTVGGIALSDLTLQSQGSGALHAHNIVSDGAHGHNIFVSNAPSHNHGIINDGNHAHNVTVNTVPPYYALCMIMKL